MHLCARGKEQIRFPKRRLGAAGDHRSLAGKIKENRQTSRVPTDADRDTLPSGYKSQQYQPVMRARAGSTFDAYSHRQTIALIAERLKASRKP
ncbi:hypothetical protein ACFSQQ_27840 [Mesorhizobium kowhaii]|uniref:hypothetical protein n=1 Tax=Mesorhizobium kowhaii TaxID=1300272 RepID=UPI0035E607F5